jgi:UDP-2,3-diacylglucosamine hydrolase
MAVARKLRGDSEAGRMATRAGAPPRHYGDAAPAAVSALLRASDASLLIHGHTHRPARHQSADGVRWVLTDWDLDGARPRASTLQLDADGFRVLNHAD